MREVELRVKVWRSKDYFLLKIPRELTPELENLSEIHIKLLLPNSKSKT